MGKKDPMQDGHDLSTSIGRATGSNGFDESGKPIYRNRNIVLKTFLFN